ncbi:MAG: GTP-binding protein [archaeon]|nr:GTP-binding protein [archaeon]
MFPTANVEVFTKDYSVENKNFLIKLYDTSGDSKFKFLLPNFYRKADAAMIVFDFSSKESFNEVSFWVNTIRDKVENIPLIIIGNKNDLKERQISDKEIRNIETKLEVKVLSTSVKNDTGINEAFWNLIKIVIENKNNEFNKGILIGNENNQRRKSFC